MRFRQWLSKWWFPSILYGVIVVMLWLYVRDTLRYRGVENWPSVPVEQAQGGGLVTTYRRGSHSGPEVSSRVDSSHIKYTYVVDGVTYRGTLGSPARQRAPINLLRQPWRAYYKPSNPSIAVLNPIPYDGFALLAGIGFFGALPAAHFYFSRSSSI